MELDRKKEADPLKTVEKARGILAELGLMTIEAWKVVFHPGKEEPKSFSVRVDIPSCGVGSNGKGTTRPYALASAYGELMERLQNLILFPVERFTRESLTKYDFLYFPDERFASIEEVAQSDDAFSQMVYKHFYKDRWLLECGMEERKKAIKVFQETEVGVTGSNLVTWPFYSVKEDKTVYLWNRFVTYLHGSNGMCAGNTPAEALVQGFSEIFERYASTEILSKGIIPPDIPSEVYRQYGTIAALIDEIEQMGPFKVLVKDCSLGKGLPVSAVVLIDYEKQRYCVSFGCHPHLPIGVERCLTEMLQGYNPRNSHENDARLISIETDARSIDPYLNVRNMHCNGKGILSQEFFVGNPSYEHVNFKDMSDAGNDDMLQYCIDLALSLAPDVFIRDVSYLGFPAYYILVPGISHYETTQRLVNMDTAYSSLADMDQYREDLDEKKLKKFLIGLNRWENSSAKEELPVSVYKLKTAALLMLGYYEQLGFYLEHQIRYISDEKERREFSALLKVIQMMVAGCEKDKIETYISLFYSPEMLDKIKSQWLCKNPVALLFSDTPYDEMTDRDREVNEVFCRLKERYSQTKIVQQDLRNLFHR